MGFAYVVAGLSATQAGLLANQVLFAGAKVASFKFEVLIFAIAAVVLALGPLGAFAGHLARCRFTGQIQYGRLATDYARLFHERWIEQGQRTDLLGSPDIQSLADLSSSCAIVEKTRLLPFAPRLAVMVACAAVAPVLPVALLEVPLAELLAKLGGVFLGKGPG